ncbi:MAG TPA: peptide chain release factor N(5)-glutamine methyltransferase [Gammaproteobacteria bacterium]|nr:peptide chain release factor N(5)-glutamine methyltransferase [Gammaproteobacteria bacterium]
MTSIQQAIAHAAAALADSDSPRLDAEVLLAHVLERPRSYLYTWPDRELSAEQASRFRVLVERRASGTPVAHITGRREFWSLDLEVTPDTLIPRPDTETLVAIALGLLPAEGTATVADLGTGSGAIALALAHERPDWQVVAVDRSAPALTVARRNARRLELTNVHPVLGDWCAALASDRFHLIVCNPPYVAAGDSHLQSGDVRHEPTSALAAGPDGLDDLRRIIPAARRCLRAGGWLALEHGYDQARAVRALLEQAEYDTIDSHSDLAGQLRVTTAHRTSQ